MTVTIASTSTATKNRTNRRTLRILGAVAVGTALTAGLVGCGSGTQDAADSTKVNALAPSKVSIPVDADVVGEAPASDPSAGGGQPAPSSSDGGGQAQALPVIDSFMTPDSIDCHNGNFQEFTASWTTTNAHDVTISIDGPGVYAQYAADGETSLPFNCSTSHTFLLTAHGDHGTTATRTITLEPRNVQTPSDDEGDDEQALPSGTSAKISAGATGDGPATQRDCDAYATQINSLDDIAVGATNEQESDAAIAEANRYENEAMSVGCFIVYAA